MNIFDNLLLPMSSFFRDFYDLIDAVLHYGFTFTLRDGSVVTYTTLDILPLIGVGGIILIVALKALRGK